MLNWLLLDMLLSLQKVPYAFPSLAFISSSAPPTVEIVVPRQTSFSASSMSFPSIWIFTLVLTFYFIITVHQR